MKKDRRDLEKRNGQTDKMKLIVLIVSTAAFLISVVAKLISPGRDDIRDVTTVFIIVAGFVFGSNVANLFINRSKE